MHYAEHCLALACNDAANDVPFIKTFQGYLQDLHIYLWNSASPTAVLKAASSVLEVNNLKVTVRNQIISQHLFSHNLPLHFLRLSPYVSFVHLEVKDTSWLLQDTAISTLQRNMTAVLAALAKETEKKDPGARGLYTHCAMYRFVVAIHL